MANEENVLRTLIEFVVKNLEPTKQQVKALSKVLEDIGGESKQVTTAIDTMFKAMGKDTPLKDLKAELKGLSKIYRDEVRKIAGEGGNAADAINVLSPDQQKRVIDLQKAITAATVSESQKRENARERESKTVQAAIDKDIAAIERERQARNRAVSSQFAQASARDKAQASAAREAQSTAQASRAYNNLSTSIDNVIASRQQESRAFAQSLQARLREEQATTGAANATSRLQENLPRLRYALFDVSTSLTIAGAAMLGFSVIAFKTAIDYERQFADVIRTTGATGDAIGEMRKEFLELNSTLPISFRQLSEIGTLAGQLNIPTADIAEFTELVAKFSATTNVSIEQSATAFGRLRELLGLTSDQFENLGSSILGVGVNSVATESQIIAITTQLAGIASQAGLSADELIGLSAALASVGIQPELARGTITRLFGQISRSVTLGGESLESFGAIAGMSGSQFASGWANAPVDTLLEFFDGVKARGGDAEAALREVGITSVRDVPAILRLAQTIDTVLRPALQVASEEFDKGTALQEQYGIIAQTTAERLKVLVQNFQLLLNALGSSATAFTEVIDFLAKVLRGFTAIASNPIGGAILGLVTILSALGGILLIVAGLSARAGASVFALRTALIELAVSSGAYSTSALAASASTRTLLASMTGATGAARGLGLAFKGLAASTGIGLLFVGIALLIEGIGAASESATQKAERFFGDLGAFSDAVKADTEAFNAGAEAIATFAVAFDEVPESAQNATTAAETWLGVQSQIAGTVDGATEAITGQTIAIGENAEAVLRNTLAQSEAINKLANDPTLLAAFTDLGGNIDDFIKASLAGNGEQYARELLAPINAEINRLSALDIGGDASNAAKISELDAVSRGLTATLLEQGSVNDLLIASMLEKAATDAFLSSTTGDLTQDTEALRSAMELLIVDIFQVANDSRVMESALGGLGEALFNTGAASAFTSSEFQKTIETIVAQSGSSQAAANNLQAFFDALVNGGIASRGQLGFLTQTIAGLLALTGKGAKTQTVAPFDVSALRKGFEGAAQASARTARSAGRIGSEVRKANVEVRTLLDYAGDLSKIFSRAFDIRFKSALAVDGIANTWETLSDRIRDARLETDKLTADKAIKEYFLSVAEGYGDELRAGVLRGEIADINEKLAETQADASTELEGNTRAARENRSTITGLVKEYQDYITSLAESGADQATLNAAVARSEAEFTDQARALGFSNEQLQPYIASFRDMTTVIANVPRNVTVTANANPALQALAEYNAALDAARANAERGIPATVIPSPIIGPAVDTFATRQAAFITLINARAAYVQKLISERNFSGADSAATSLNALRERLRLGQFYSGGFTGRGGKYEPAGIVHRGEYVVPKSQVNQSTGLPNANALGGQMPASRGPSYAGGGMVTGMGASMMVELSPIDRKLLAAAGNVSLSIDGRVISGTVARNNTVDALRGTN